MKTLLATMLLMAVVTPAAGAQDLEADLMKIENSLWAAWGRKDPKPTESALTEDAVTIVAGTAPVEGRAALAKMLPTLPCEMRSFTLHGAKLRQVTPDVVILSYTATQDTTCEGKKLPAKLQATSVYVRQRGKWLQTSYQETALE